MPKIKFATYKLKSIGEWRWSDKNESFSFVDYSDMYNIPIYMILSFFQDKTIAVGFFSRQDYSETSRFENIGHFNYGPTRKLFIISKTIEKEMLKDIQWVKDTIDEYQASWEEEEIEIIHLSRRNSYGTKKSDYL